MFKTIRKTFGLTSLDIEGIKKIDSWLVLGQHQAVFEGIKETHHLQPLVVYNEKDNFVKLEDVPSTIKGSLVEVMLKLKHYYI